MTETQKIFLNFGYKEQVQKLKEEALELVEALENKDIDEIYEEFADVMNLLIQFKESLNLDTHVITYNIERKVRRTLKRIEEGYYKQTDA